MTSVPAQSVDRLRLRGLLFRSTLMVILVSLLTGLVSVAYTAYATSQHAHLASQTRLKELLDTVESTLQVACFANDATLARELAQGLLNNSDVLAVLIAGNQQQLVDMRRDASSATAAANTALKRLIHSPFDASKPIGHILLTPDPQVIEARIREEVKLAALQLSWQLAMVAFAVAAIMLLFIVRPIKAMSDRLHAMDPTTGERLPVPSQHKNTEIGQLVGDINTLAHRLVNTLATERRLRLQREIDEKKFHAIFDNAESGIFIVDDRGALSSWNPAFARLFQISASHEGDKYTWLNIALLPWQDPTAPAKLISNALQRNSAVGIDLLLLFPDTQQRWVNIVLSPIGDNQLQGITHDISHFKEAEATARQQIVTDPLTGLANRLGLEERLQALIQDSAINQCVAFALLLVNLDEFRRVNEGFGLPAGDKILQTTTLRLSSCVKHGDTVARLSADVFGIILQDVFQGDVADNVANRVSEAIRQPYFIDGSLINLHASTGITLFPNDAIDVPNLLRQAELAMDSAKSAGGDMHVFFDPVLSEAAVHRRLLENDLRAAIRKQEFVLFFQPIVDLQARRVSGAEALIRWWHPTRGLIAPDNFIPLAEQTGLIVEIGLFVLEAACQQLQTWQQQRLDYTLSINVSGGQIPDGLSPARLLDTINRYGVPASRLALEITEGVMLRDIEKSQLWLDAVHEMGFRVYLDDFGTGYSSLSYLKRFPVDTLKVDKSFVQDMQTDNNEFTLVSAIIAMGRSLGLEIIAEGVEKESHAHALQHVGCRYVQGYLYARPLSADAFDAAVEQIQAELGTTSLLPPSTITGESLV